LKNKNIYELDPERLASTDELGHRVYIHPEDVKGKWKDRRQIVYWFLIFLYLVLPWFNVGGKPAILLDILHREFTFLGYTLHGVQPVLMFLVVASGLFLIGFATSLFGRVWCGWACPQTVFIQSLFLKIESFIEGRSLSRRALEEAPWTFKKVFKRTLKWTAFTLISLHIAHTFIGYFIGPRVLFEMTLRSPAENWGVFLGVMGISLIFLLDFGWFREQFCIIACPYGRMQSVLMDENSLVVSYDTKRGEPRRGLPEYDKNTGGDCVNCYNCVKVCPTGIDIRRGTQLECIACTQCIDACDEVMVKVQKPTGLIRYSSENELNGKPRKILTPRSAIYAMISMSFIALFFYTLNASTHLDLVFLRSKVPYQVVDSGATVINHFTLKLSHQGNRVYDVNFSVAEPQFREQIEIVSNTKPTTVDVPEKRVIVFFKFSTSVLESGSRKITVLATDSHSHEVLSTKEITLVGPTH
jgi:cytochrome c oxidase accessory protein FixG